MALSPSSQHQLLLHCDSKSDFVFISRREGAQNLLSAIHISWINGRVVAGRRGKGIDSVKEGQSTIIYTLYWYERNGHLWALTSSAIFKFDTFKFPNWNPPTLSWVRNVFGSGYFCIYSGYLCVCVYEATLNQFCKRSSNIRTDIDFFPYEAYNNNLHVICIYDNIFWNIMVI